MNIKSNFNRNAIILMGINLLVTIVLVILSKVVFGEGIPLFLIPLSLLGLFIVAISCGPWAGALMGTVNLLIITGGSIPVVYYADGPEPFYRAGYPEWLLYAVMGFVVGVLAQKGFFKTWWSSILAGYLTSGVNSFLFNILDQIFDTANVGAQRIPGIWDIANAAFYAAFSIFDELRLGFPSPLLMVFAFVAFGIINQPFSRKTFMQGLPQAGKTFSLAYDTSENAISQPQSESNQPVTNTVKGVGIFFILVVSLVIMAFIMVLSVFSQ